MRFPALAPLLALLACVQTPPAPAPPEPRPVAIAPTAPPAAPLAANWQDWPITPGDWAYRRDARGSVALFGPVGEDARFVVRCDDAARRIYLSRAGRFAADTSSQMAIRATTASKAYLIRNNGDTPPYVAAELLTTDPHLDAMAFSRGRFLVSVKGAADLVIPPWPELARVIEDCRH